MKKQMMLGLLLFSTVIIYAQVPEKPEKFFLNAGVGISLSDYVPTYMGIDYMFAKNISLNLEYSFARRSKGNYLIATQAYMIGIHYHFNDLWKLNKKWDLYAGPIFELESMSSQGPVLAASSDKYYQRVWGANVGARYFLTDRLALNAKIGYGNIGSAGTVGISVKF